MRHLKAQHEEKKPSRGTFCVQMEEKWSWLSKVSSYRRSEGVTFDP